MRDGLLRRCLKAVVRSMNTVDLAVTRAVKPRAPYRLLGSCNGCGRCCESPGIPVRKFVWYLPTARRVFLWWQRLVNGFVLKESDARTRTFFFTCTHYDAVTKRCDSYESRPLMCRDYPVNLIYEGVPPLFDECSYVVQARNAKALKAELVKAGVTGDKLAEMEKKLFLRGLDE